MTASLYVLITILIGVLLGSIGLWQFWASRTTRKRGILLLVVGAVLQFWWLFFLLMAILRPT